MGRQSDSEKMAHVSLCDVSGTILQSCKVMLAIRNVYDLLESLRRRPAVVNLRRVKFKTIPLP